jgi:uncharacterized damage-inducible protein DinB
MKEFLLRKFETEHYALQSLIRCIEAQEDQVPEFSINSICHIININHRWNSRLNGTKPESNDWDVFPLHYLEKLNNQNYRETCDYLEKKDLNRYFQDSPESNILLDQTATDILFHLLQHSAYHRGQIVLNLKSHGSKFPINGFVQLED